MPRPSDDPRYHGARWKRLRAQTIRAQGRRCARPDCTTDMTLPGETHVDHINTLPPHAPDTDFYDPTNLQILCKRHHFAKSLDVAAATKIRTSPNA